MQALEMEAEIDENNEIHIKLPKPYKPGHARVIVLLDEDQDTVVMPKKHRPSPRLAYKGAKLHGDDAAPAFSLDEWGEMYR